ncbi:MAG: CHASE3 domain-containing protein [Sphingomonas sp.]|uniref:ATP-binding protein n=1 Tax=Sphingomonas sp. TaxID=28214 RepID=UPI001AD3073A|nr:ATP-binding protein [Sphingomonas sp.]MBN8808379.1 CHASE3 domain-containing protein [Sphingomonas sp.]
MGGSVGEGFVDTARKAWRGVALAMLAVAGVGILIALFAIQDSANARRDEALRLQSHSYDVMILTRSLSSTIAEAEAALGRYVVSGDEQIGRRFTEEWDRARDQIDRLDAITDDNPAQQAPIDRLRAAYEERGRELAVTASSTAYGRDRQAYARFYEAGKSRSLSEIDRDLDTIIESERGLLDKRTQAAVASVHRSTTITTLLSVFGVLVVLGAIVLAWLTLAAMHERANARAEAESERERAKTLEDAVATATAALREQEAKFRQAQKMEAIGQLTGGIAHDFNNMLAVVLGGLELAQRALDGDTAAARRHLDSAAEGADRAAALTRRLLVFSREEALSPEAMVPAEAVAGMSDLLDRTLGDAITVNRSDDGAGWAVHCDRHELENALVNLAVNARDAMEGRGVLTIATRGVSLAAGEVGDCAAGDHVAIAVGDSGCGMAPEILDRVFEPFFTTKPVGRGTGLGLSQTFGFVRQSGGDVAITSTPGAGTTVTLYLPRHLGEPVGKVPAGAAPTESTADGAPLAILLVEDDPRVLAATAAALGELGHRVTTCNDPFLAPALLDRQGPFDLVVSDVLMPGRTGPEMVGDLLLRHPDLAILFVTGYAGDGVAADFGGRPVLRKPFTIAGLAQAIGEAMATARPGTAHAIAAE